MSAALPVNGGNPWPRALAALGAVLAALLWLYRDTALGMVTIWLRSETFTHAFTVPGISLWLIWRRRARLERMTPRPVPWLVLPMALVGLAWLMGHLAAVNAVAQFALVTLLVLSVPAVLGWDVAREIRFPLLFLFFAVPFGEFLIPVFMEWTADFTVWALQLSGIPVLREGLQFTIPSGNWSVETACSGIRYLMASMMVGVLFAYLNYRSMLRRWVFVGISIAVPILANWVRAYLIVLVGHLSGNEIATGADHLVYGWLFFGIVILLMLSIGAFWSQPEGPLDPAAPPQPPVAAPQGAARLMIAAVAALVVLALPHGLLARVDGREARVRPDSLEQAVAPAAAGWVASAQPASDWQNSFDNPTMQLRRSFVQSGREVGLQVAYYASEAADSKLVSSNNSLATVEHGQGWAQVRTGKEVVAMQDGTHTWRSVELRRVGEAQGAGARLVVWQLYWINGSLTASDAWAKVLLALNRLRGREGGAAILVYTPKTTAEQDRAALESFLASYLDKLLANLRQVHDAAAGA